MEAKVVPGAPCRCLLPQGHELLLRLAAQKCGLSAAHAHGLVARTREGGLGSIVACAPTHLEWYGARGARHS